MNKEKSSFGIIQFAVIAAGGYLLWRNRFKVQRMLEAQGVKTPWMTNTLTDTVKSGVAIAGGNIEKGLRSFNETSLSP